MKICDLHISKSGRSFCLEYYQLNEEETISKYVFHRMVKYSTLIEKLSKILKENELV